MTTPTSDVPDPEQEEVVPLGAGISFTDPNSPLAPYYLGVGHVLAVFLLATIAVIYSLMPLWHTDVWAHARYGKWIVEQNTIPKTNNLSPFTDATTEFGSLQWLTQVTYAKIYQWGSKRGNGDATQQIASGAEGLRTYHFLLTMLRFGLLFLAFWRISGSIIWACIGLTILFFAMLPVGAMQRPQFVGMACFAAIMLALSREVLTRRATIGIPILMVFWANAHGSFAAGLLLLALTAVSRYVDLCRREGRIVFRPLLLDPSMSRVLLTTCVSLLAIGLLNPYGFTLYQQVRQFSKHPNVPTMAEWLPLPFEGTSGGHWAYLAAIVLLLITQILSPVPLRTSQVSYILVFGVWPLLQERMMVWWLMLVPWIVVSQGPAIVHRFAWAARLPEPMPNFRNTLLVGMLIFVSLVWSPLIRWTVTGKSVPVTQALSQGTPYRLALELTATPELEGKYLPELRSALRQPRPTGKGIPVYVGPCLVMLPVNEPTYSGGKFIGTIFASETLGDYLFWALPNEMPVMMFTHAHLFSETYWQECLEVKAGNPIWEEVLDRYRVNLVIVETQSHRALISKLMASNAWEVILDETDDRSITDVRNRKFIALRKVPK